MSKHCVKEVPNGYELEYSIDAASKKVGIILNVFAIIITIVIAVLGMLIMTNGTIDFTISFDNFPYLLIFTLSIFLYLVLHELTHGICYKIFTKEKLKFGLTFSCAYCGVPDVYVDRVTAMVSVIMPTIVYSIGFLVPCILIQNTEIKYIFLFLFSFHFGGCIGDLYVFGLYLFKFKGKVFMKDTGAKQEFYIEK